MKYTLNEKVYYVLNVGEHFIECLREEEVEVRIRKVFQPSLEWIRNLKHLELQVHMKETKISIIMQWNIIILV